MIATMPCSIDLLRVTNTVLTFYEFDEYARLVRAARGLDRRSLLVVLLGGDAGIRASEMMALEWKDVDLGRRQLIIQRAAWHGIVDTPKSGRGRIVPMTDALAEALSVPRQGRALLWCDDGHAVDAPRLRSWLRAARSVPRA